MGDGLLNVGERLPPIERDEGTDRTYIPVPGGFEVQTKGSGSTFRIYDGRHDIHLPVLPQPGLFEVLERMAKEAHAEVMRLENEVDRLRRLQTSTIDGWRPIDTAPRDGTPVLACVAGPYFYADKVQWSASAGAWLYPCMRHGPAVPPTHWMPLPEPPKAPSSAAIGSDVAAVAARAEEGQP